MHLVPRSVVGGYCCKKRGLMERMGCPVDTCIDAWLGVGLGVGIAGLEATMMALFVSAWLLVEAEDHRSQIDYIGRGFEPVVTVISQGSHQSMYTRVIHKIVIYKQKSCHFNSVLTLDITT